MNDWRKPSGQQYQRLIGLIVLSTAVTAFLVVLLTLQTTDTTVTAPAANIIFLGGIPLWYSWQAPPVFAVVAAIAIGTTVVVAFV
jgi:Ni/Fe-hydrogenase subunit HybB-like protein